MTITTERKQLLARVRYFFEIFSDCAGFDDLEHGAIVFNYRLGLAQVFDWNFNR